MSKPIAYITQAGLESLEHGISASVRVWLNAEGDIPLYTAPKPC